MDLPAPVSPVNTVMPVPEVEVEPFHDGEILDVQMPQQPGPRGATSTTAH